MFPSNHAIMTNQNTIAGLGVTINSGDLQLKPPQKQELQDLLHLDSLDLHCSEMKYTINVHNQKTGKRSVMFCVECLHAHVFQIEK